MRAAGPVRLLVLDPAGDFMDADENSAEAVKPLMRQLRAIAALHGCSIILLGHLAKGMDGDTPSMRGSGAWAANSRFAYALFPPKKDEAESRARKLACPPDAVASGSLVKANHAGAPVNVPKWFRRGIGTGRLIDMTPPAARDLRGDDAALLDILVTACGECAAAGLPFTVTGTAGLYQNRADLLPESAELPRARLAALGNAALASHRLVKPGNNQAQGTTKYLDLPDGPLATGTLNEMVTGSRAEALAKCRTRKCASGDAIAGVAGRCPGLNYQPTQGRLAPCQAFLDLALDRAAFGRTQSADNLSYNRGCDPIALCKIGDLLLYSRRSNWIDVFGAFFVRCHETLLISRPPEARRNLRLHLVDLTCGTPKSVSTPSAPLPLACIPDAENVSDVPMNPTVRHPARGRGVLWRPASPFGGPVHLRARALSRPSLPASVGCVQRVADCSSA